MTANDRLVLVNQDDEGEIVRLVSDPRLISAVAAASSFIHGWHKDGELLLRLARSFGGAPELIRRLRDEPVMAEQDVSLVQQALATVKANRQGPLGTVRSGSAGAPDAEKPI